MGDRGWGQCSIGMKLLVGIQGHSGDQAVINLNALSWMRSGGRLIGLHAKDSPVEQWPECVASTEPVEIRDGKWMGYGLRPCVLADCFRLLMKTAMVLDYDWVLWTESDAVFFKGAPQLEPGFHCFIAGYCPSEWNCGNGPFLHPPFFVDVKTAFEWCCAEELYRGDIGNGTPDVYAALVCQSAGIKIQQCPGVWSTNGLDMRVSSKLDQARSHYRSGAWHIHGIKRNDHLDFITGNSYVYPADTIYQ